MEQIYLPGQCCAGYCAADVHDLSLSQAARLCDELMIRGRRARAEALRELADELNAKVVEAFAKGGQTGDADWITLSAAISEAEDMARDRADRIEKEQER